LLVVGGRNPFEDPRVTGSGDRKGLFGGGHASPFHRPAVGVSNTRTDVRGAGQRQRVRISSSLSWPDIAPQTSPGRPSSWRTAAFGCGCACPTQAWAAGSKCLIEFSPQSVSHTVSASST